MGAGASRASGLGAALLVGIFALLMSTRLFGLLALLPVFDVLRWPFKGFPLAAFYLLLAGAWALRDVAEPGGGRARLAAGLAWGNLLLQLADPPAGRLAGADRALEARGHGGRAARGAAGAGDRRPGPAAPAAGRRRAARPQRRPGPGLPLRHPGRQIPRARLRSAGRQDQRRDRLPAETNGALVVRAERLARLVPALPRYLLVDAGEPAAAAAGRHRRRCGWPSPAATTCSSRTRRAIPIVSRREGGEALPFRWRTNGLELDLPADFPGGHLLFNVAGLAGLPRLPERRKHGRPRAAPPAAPGRAAAARPRRAALRRWRLPARAGSGRRRPAAVLLLLRPPRPPGASRPAG